MDLKRARSDKIPDRELNIPFGDGVERAARAAGKTRDRARSRAFEDFR